MYARSITISGKGRQVKDEKLNNSGAKTWFLLGT